MAAPEYHKPKTSFFQKCGEKEAQARQMLCAIGADVPADAMDPCAHGEGRRSRRYGTVWVRPVIITALLQLKLD